MNLNDTTSPRRAAAIYWTAILAVLLVAAGLEAASAVQDSQTQDEAVHLTAGYSYWTTGDFRLNTEHPPLSKLLQALPLLWLRPELKTNTVEWKTADQWGAGKQFLYGNRVPADTMLIAGRSVTILFGVALGASLGWWVARHVNRKAGLAAVLLFAFEPTVMAHAHYVTSDIPVTLFVWLACISAFSYAAHPKRLALVLTGVFAGLAFATKLNALFLPFALFWIFKTPGKLPWRALMTTFAIALMVVLLTYGFDTTSVMQDPVLSLQVGRQTLSGPLRAAADLPVPGFYFLRALHLLLRHQTGGHLTYFMEAISNKSSWLYFPVAFLVKSLLAWLAMLALAMGITVFGKRSNPVLRLLLVPIAVYVVVAMLSSIHIGIRHLLPVYPFLCAALAVILFRDGQTAWIRRVSWALLALFLAESASAFPNYLGYFNVAAGGSSNGHRYLLDSNLDWGQDLKRLAEYTRDPESQPLCLAYFGTASPEYYGIRSQPLRPVRTPADLQSTDCMAAVSAEYLYGIPEQPLSLLRDRPPDGRIGTSIYLYDLRHRKN